MAEISTLSKNKTAKFKPIETIMGLFQEKYLVNNENGWFEWIGQLNDRGYGYIGIGSNGNGRTVNVRAHRLSYFLCNDGIPDGMMVLHKCDNRKCVNPEHLFLGTNGDNAKDMMQKGRGKNQIGTFAMNILSPETVISIKKDILNKVGSKKIQLKYGISESNFYRIKNGKSWKRLNQLPTTPPSNKR